MKKSFLNRLSWMVLAMISGLKLKVVQMVMFVSEILSSSYTSKTVVSNSSNS